MSTNPKVRAWVEVRADSLRRNYARVRRAVGADVGVLPMVKADAYGLGVAEVVQVLEPESPWGYGVATVAEGVSLRSSGVERRIVVCSPAPEVEVEQALTHGLQLSVSSLEALAVIEKCAREGAIRASIHVEVDTGMGRSGFDWRTASDWLAGIQERTGRDIEWVGIYTHLHSADENEGSVREQWARFTDVLSGACDLPEGLVVHLLNSAGSFRTPDFARSIVRPGIFLYGGEIGVGQPAPEPVVAVRARVVHVRDVVEGTTVGYGATYQARRAERWATLAIGYGDGLSRSLGNRGGALIRGCRVPIVGRISMDVTVVDSSDMPSVAVGDVATLIGSDGEETITLDEVARQAGTISYEVLTGLTPRLPRVWMNVPEESDG
jgi:alanine racemase